MRHINAHYFEIDTTVIYQTWALFQYTFTIDTFYHSPISNYSHYMLPSIFSLHLNHSYMSCSVWNQIQYIMGETCFSFEPFIYSFTSSYIYNWRVVNVEHMHFHPWQFHPKTQTENKTTWSIKNYIQKLF